MSIRCIQTDDILVDGSLFSLKAALFGVEEGVPGLTRSLQEFGILSPVTVFKDHSNNLHLIDGFRRVRFALDTGLPAVEATVLPDSTLVEEIISLVLHNKRSIISGSLMNKICFVSFAVSLNVPEECIVHDLCRALELKPHRSILEECERIKALPHELKSFCHEKRFSLKQILNLSHHPEDLLVQLMSWRQVLQLSASVLDEIASNLKDHLRANGIDIKAFVSDAEVENVIDSDLSSRDKTDRLRKLISARRYPVLSEVNERIESAVSRINLPDSTTVTWDRTLENRGVNISISIKNPDEWNSVMESMNTGEIRKIIKDILNEL